MELKLNEAGLVVSVRQIAFMASVLTCHPLMRRLPLLTSLLLCGCGHSAPPRVKNDAAQIRTDATTREQRQTAIAARRARLHGEIAACDVQLDTLHKEYNRIPSPTAITDDQDVTDKKDAIKAQIRDVRVVRARYTAQLAHLPQNDRSETTVRR